MSHLYRHPPKTGNYWLAFWKNGKLSRYSLKTKDRATARYLQAKHEQESAQGKNILPSYDNLVAPVFKAYKEFKSGQRSLKYHAAVCARINSYITWAQVTTFHQITEDTLQKYLNHLLNPIKPKLPISGTTANHIIRDVNELLNYALKRDVIPKNNLGGFKKVHEEKKLRQFFTKEELQNLLKEANKPEHYADGNPTLFPLLLTAIFTGMRRNELFKLEWSNIDFKGDTIYIINKADFKTKTLHERTIPLSPSLKEVLLKLKARSKSNYCFDTTNWRRLINRILEAAKLKRKGDGFHILRHSFASHLIMDTGDIKGASELLGHRNIETTMIYTHTLKDHLRRTMQKYNPLGV